MKFVQIFLASSAELADDRKNFERFLSRINNDWIKHEIYFALTIWEDFIDAMSRTRLQDEYNKAIKQCDIFLLLFYTKVGIYTSEEFETAFGAFKENNKPLIFIYFKDSLILTGDIDRNIITMLDFKKKIEDLGHFLSRYKSMEDLQWQFGRQLEKLYRDGVSKSDEISSSSTQLEIDLIALNLINRILLNFDVDKLKLKEAICKSSENTKYEIFLRTRQTRKDNWLNNAGLMEKTIPIFESLIESDSRKVKHYYYSQLAYALKDKPKPDYKSALENLNIAIEIRGSINENGYPLYEFNRAVCLIALDKNFLKNECADDETKQKVRDDLKKVVRNYSNVNRLMADPLNRNIVKWV